MAIFYVNINNAYVAVGDGSLGNPFNYADMRTHVDANPAGNHTYRLTGKRVVTTPNESLFASSSTPVYNVEPTDPTQPWRVENTTGQVILYSGAGSTIKGGIIKSVGDINIVNATIFNLYVISNAEVVFPDSSAKGSTIIGTILRFSRNNIGLHTVVNSVLVSLSSQIRCTFDSTLNLDNCVVSVAEVNLIEETGPYAQVGTINVNTVQFSWVPAVALPTSIDLLSTDVLEQTIAPNSTINDITVLANATFTGYEAGLFGGLARTTSAGIGAFAFVALVPPTTETSNDLLVTIDGEEVVSVSYLADTDKDLTYLVYVDGTGNLKMNKVREPSVDDKLLGSGAVEN